MHPTLDRRIVDEAYESDPEAARAEYGAEFRDDLADFVTREAIDAVTMWGRSELPPEPGVTYSAFCDPSGGVRDAMTLAIAHLSRGGACVLDAALEVRPPFHPDAGDRGVRGAAQALWRRQDNRRQIRRRMAAGEVRRARDRIRAERSSEKRSLWRPAAVDQRRAD